MQSIKEFHKIRNEIPIGNEIPFFMFQINQIWTVALLCNAMSLLIVNDTTNETETFLKNVK